MNRDAPNDEQHDELTQILRAVSDGDEAAREQLFAFAYDELRGLAARLMQGERENHTLQPTALVNEAGVRFLSNLQLDDPDGRAFFFWTMARAMRQVLVDHARKRNAQRRGGDQHAIALEDADQLGDTEESIDVLALDEALDELQQLDPRQSKVVELRFFGGFEMQEIANQLDVSLSTVEKDWRVARAWLRRKLA